MIDDVKAMPGLAQTNAYDTALELTKMHFDYRPVDKGDVQKMKEVYKGFYALARSLEYINPEDLACFVSEDVKNILIRYKEKGVR